MNININMSKREFTANKVKLGDKIKFVGIHLSEPDELSLPITPVMVVSGGGAGYLDLRTDNGDLYRLVVVGVSNVIRYSLVRQSDLAVVETGIKIKDVLVIPVGLPNTYQGQMLFYVNNDVFISHTMELVEKGVVDHSLVVGDSIVGHLHIGWFEDDEPCWNVNIYHEDLTVEIKLVTDETETTPDQVVAVCEYGVLTMTEGDDVFVSADRKYVLVPHTVICGV